MAGIWDCRRTNENVLRDKIGLVVFNRFLIFNQMCCRTICTWYLSCLEGGSFFKFLLSNHSQSRKLGKQKGLKKKNQYCHNCCGGHHHHYYDFDQEEFPRCAVRVGVPALSEDHPQRHQTKQSTQVPQNDKIRLYLKQENILINFLNS